VGAGCYFRDDSKGESSVFVLRYFANQWKIAYA
jgi:hypothetical protein